MRKIALLTKCFGKMSLLNCVPCVLKTCSRTNVPCVLTCLRSNVSSVLMCQRVLRVHVPCKLTNSHASVPCVLLWSRANLSCVLTLSRVNVASVLTCQRALRAHVPVRFECLRASRVNMPCLYIHVSTGLASSHAHVSTCLESPASHGLHNYVITCQHVLPLLSK